ncbi:MAG: ROK family protein [Thermodesulfobacteriota bacterium]
MTKERDGLALGIDLGGTKILTSVVNPGGKMISRDHSVTPAARGQEAVIQAIMESTKRALDQARITISDLTCIGIGAPGPSNPQTGILYSSPNLPGWRDVPLRDIISERLGLTAYLINDGSAAAVGEMHYGAAQGARHFIYLTISTGIGGGIVVNGEIYAGSIGTAGELGHMVIDDNGPLCNCGNTGCWEMLASGTALAAEAKRLVDSGSATAILDYGDGAVENITAETVHKAALAGDELAKRLIARNAYYLGVGLANLINIFNPETIVIGGGLSNIGDMLLLPAYEEAQRRAFKPSYQATRFVRARLGRNSGVIGAAAFALEQAKKAVK